MVEWAKRGLALVGGTGFWSVREGCWESQIEVTPASPQGVQ